MPVAWLSLVAGSIFVVFALYRYVIYPALVSPLAKIPTAHWSCAISPSWMLWKRFVDKNNETIYTAHRRRGPIVRLGPSEVSINCVEDGVRTVYVGGMEKHRWYPDQFASHGAVNMFSTTGHKAHSVRKRMVSNVYSKSFLQSSRQVAENSIVLLRDRFLPFLHQAAEQGATVEVHEMNNAFTMDFVSAYLFGIANSTNFTHDHVSRRRFLSIYHGRRPFDFFFQEVPNLTRFIQRLGFRLIPKSVDEANQDIEAWLLKLCDAADLKSVHTTSPGSEPVVYKQLKTSMEKSGKTVEKAQSAERVRLEIASEMQDHINAGHETSAVALTYLYWELSKHSDQQRRLREELLGLEPPLSEFSRQKGQIDLPSPKALDSLPLLHAVIMETLRLHSPVGGIQPRITPEGGCSLAGYANIPAKVRVSAMAFALHRNENVFPEPDDWDVDRWMQPEGSAAMQETQRWFWAFGSGGRMCVGRHLAMQEMKLIVAAIYSNFTTSVVDDDGMEAIDAYATRPRGNRLMIKFRPVHDDQAVSSPETTVLPSA